MPTEQAELTTEQVLRRDIPWETYMTTKLITGTGLQLLRRYDKKAESYRAQLLDDVLRPEEREDADYIPTEEEVDKGDISVWVKNRAKSFGRVLGVSCKGHEDKIIELLLKIEKGRTPGRLSIDDSKTKTKKIGKFSRELKNLCCNINFDGESSRGRGGRGSKFQQTC